MTGKTHSAIALAATSVTLLATGPGLRGHGVFAEGSRNLLSLSLSSTPLATPTPNPSVASSLGNTGLGNTGAEAALALVTAPALWSLFALLLLGVVAGLFPDLDAPQSELLSLPRSSALSLSRLAGGGHGGRGRRGGRRILSGLVRGALLAMSMPVSAVIRALSSLIRLFTGHRGFTHTLLGALFFSTLVSLATLAVTSDSGRVVTIGGVWLVGYLSHILADACTPSGIPLFWGFSWLRLFGRWRVRHSGHIGTGDRTAPRRAGTASARSLPPNSLRSSNNGGTSPSPSPGPYAGRGPARSLLQPDLPSFHLLPVRMRVRTGTWVDTIVIRWCSILVSSVSMAFVLYR